MGIRISPAFVVAVLALVLASGGVGYAAGKIDSGDIKDGTITGRDVKNESLPRTKLDDACAKSEEALFGGCVRRKAFDSSSHQAALDTCSRRNGRLPTTAEIKWIAAHEEFTWADGNPSQYEFTGDYTGSNPYTPIAFDRAGNAIANASGFMFWFHCVTY